MAVHAAPWTTILDGPLREQALEAARNIAAVLVARGEPWLRNPVTRLELATLLDELDRAGMPAGDAGEQFDRGVSALADKSCPAFLFGGLAGAGWIVTRLADEATADLVCDAIDDVVLDRLDTAEHPYDLVHGLVGIALYAVERRRSQRGPELARRVVELLEHRALTPDDPARWRAGGERRSGTGLVWWDPADQLPEHMAAQYPSGWFNLGIAHGMPGIIGAMARLVSAGIETERARRLLEGACDFVLASAPPARPARFPACLHPDQVRAPATRLAWCYGDPGIAVALLAAARALDRPDWSTEAIDIARAMSDRTLEESGVIDAGLCHGAAGVAHVFNRLFHATGIPELGDAARLWCVRTLEMRGNGCGIAGFSSPDAGGGWGPDPTLLTGASGTALALLAAASDHEPRWDGRLLMDV